MGSNMMKVYTIGDTRKLPQETSTVSNDHIMKFWNALLCKVDIMGDKPFIKGRVLQMLKIKISTKIFDT